MANFIVFYNNELLKTYELDEPVISIGRLPENTISIANMGVSRRHAKIEEDADRSYVISDLNSLNGTFVNGKKIKKVQLQSGDKIAIGKYSIQYEEVAGHRNYVPGEQYPNPVKVEAQEYIGSTDFSYVHRTTEPRLQVVADNKAEKTVLSIDMLPEENESQQLTSVLIETNKHVVYKIDRTSMTMGNSEEDDIFISGFMIGPGQVTINTQSDGIYLNANRMLGKFKVNGKSKRKHHLKHKDRIEVGSSTFRFMENG